MRATCANLLGSRCCLQKRHTLASLVPFAACTRVLYCTIFAPHTLWPRRCARAAFTGIIDESHDAIAVWDWKKGKSLDVSGLLGGGRAIAFIVNGAPRAVKRVASGEHRRRRFGTPGVRGTGV